MKVPGEVSVTLAVHKVVLPVDMELGEHNTVVDVVRKDTAIVNADVVAVESNACVASPL